MLVWWLPRRVTSGVELASWWVLAGSCSLGHSWYSLLSGGQGSGSPLGTWCHSPCHSWHCDSLGLCYVIPLATGLALPFYFSPWWAPSWFSAITMYIFPQGRARISHPSHTNSRVTQEGPFFTAHAVGPGFVWWQPLVWCWPILWESKYELVPKSFPFSLPLHRSNKLPLLFLGGRNLSQKKWWSSWLTFDILTRTFCNLDTLFSFNLVWFSKATSH